MVISKSQYQQTKLQELYKRLQLSENCAGNPAAVAFQQFASPPVKNILNTLTLPNDFCKLNQGSIFYRQVNGTLYCERQEKKSPQQFYRKDDLDSNYQLNIVAVHKPNNNVSIGLFISHNNAILYGNTSDYEIDDKNTLGLRVFQISKRLRQNLEKIITDKKTNDVELRKFLEQQNLINTILYMDRDFLLQLNP